MKKDLLAILFVILAVCVVIRGTNIQSVDEYYLTHIDDIASDSKTVTVSIRCDMVLTHYEDLDKTLQSEEFVPSDGIILPETKCVLRPEDTVFDILSRVVRYKKIQMEYQGRDQNGFGSVYIQGIHHLYEFSCGPLSGWMYRVNGEFPIYGSSKYTLRDGDVIEWIYSCEQGKDVGSSFEGKQM